MLQFRIDMTGDQLRRAREIAGLSQNWLARECGLTRGGRAIREMEEGQRPISGPVARCALFLAGVWPFLFDQASFLEDVVGQGNFPGVRYRWPECEVDNVLSIEGALNAREKAVKASDEG